MKFLKIIMALCVLLGLQNSVLFGAETPEMEQMPEMGLTEEKIAAKDAAITVLNAYINMSSKQRTLQNIQAAERALQLITAYEMALGGLLTSEEELVSRVVGVLPIDKARLTGGVGARARAVRTRGAMPARTAKRAITVKRPTAAATRTRVVKTRPTVVRPGYKPGAVRRPVRYGVGRKPTRQLPTRTRAVRTRGGVGAQAPMITVPTPTASDLQEQLTVLFGTGNLSSFFRDGSINMDMVTQAYNSIQPYIQILGQSPDNVAKLIWHTIVNNKDSGITSEQEKILIDVMYRLLQGKPELPASSGVSIIEFPAVGQQVGTAPSEELLIPQLPAEIFETRPGEAELEEVVVIPSEEQELETSPSTRPMPKFNPQPQVFPQLSPITIEPV